MDVRNIVFDLNKGLYFVIIDDGAGEFRKDFGDIDQGLLQLNYWMKQIMENSSTGFLQLIYDQNQEIIAIDRFGDIGFTLLFLQDGAAFEDGANFLESSSPNIYIVSHSSIIAKIGETNISPITFKVPKLGATFAGDYNVIVTGNFLGAVVSAVVSQSGTEWDVTLTDGVLTQDAVININSI